jgi:hypothetical protein
MHSEQTIQPDEHIWEQGDNYRGERIWTLTFNKALLNCLNPNYSSRG